jgi:Beta-propeller repeat
MFKLLSRSMILCIAMLSPAILAAAPNPTTFNRPLAFEPNRGQAPGQVSWTARGEGYQLFLTSSGATITMAEPVAPSPADPHLSIPGRPALLKGRVSAIGMHLVASHAWSKVHALEPTGAVSNYLIGSDRANWHSGIPQYRRLQVNGVYDGIDLVFYGHGRDLEYDFVLAPGADPNQIRLAFDGVGPLRIDHQTGDLVIKTNSGSEMRHVRPRVYQQIGNQKKEVAGGYQILGNGEAAFRLASYDRQHALVVDPTVEFTTFIEGNSQDVVQGLAVDSHGNSYITGQTLSTNFPNFFGPAPVKDCTHTCSPWIFVTELSPSGEVMNSTLIGGSELDLAYGIAVDPTGVWVAGVTNSTNFATHTQYGNGLVTGFVAKLSVDLAVQEWCVSFGGYGNEYTVQGAYAVAVDTNHNAYATGFTESAQFPTSLDWSTTQPMQKSLNGPTNAFVVKVGADGYLTDGYSTYLGGSVYDIGYGIAVDSAGHAFVTGLTSSPDFPTNGAASHGSPGQGSVAFVTELSADGSSSLYSVLLGGTKSINTDYPRDQGSAIAVDPNGEAYVTGSTCSSDFPTTPGAYQTAPPSACPAYGIPLSAFAAKLSNTGQLLRATYLGGGGSVNGTSIAINRLGDIYIAGTTSSGVFPGTSPITVNPTAGFVSEFDSKLETLKMSKFLGAVINGVATFHPASLPVGPGGDPDSVYTAGYRYRPGTDVNNVDNEDAFVVKLSDTP